jgi:purine-binding chemotaxis protein CheW
MEYNYTDNRFLEFHLGEPLYAIPLLSVREVVSLRPIRELPNCPKYFLGVIDLRGTVIPVIDLRKKLDIAPLENQDESAIIIISIGNILLGIVIDLITRVMVVDLQRIEQQKTTEAFAGYIIGFVYNEELKNFTALIDIAQTLDIQDIEGIRYALNTTAEGS